MPRFTDHRASLSKEDQERHFPEWSHGGKGYHARTSTALSRKNFEEGYDRIFGKKEVSDASDDASDDPLFHASYSSSRDGVSGEDKCLESRAICLDKVVVHDDFGEEVNQQELQFILNQEVWNQTEGGYEKNKFSELNALSDLRPKC